MQNHHHSDPHTHPFVDSAERSDDVDAVRAYEAFQEGSRLLDESHPHAAAVVLERARDLEPDKGSVREALARAYFRCGRFPAARSEFERAVEIEPVNDYAHFGLGLCLLRTGDRAGARRHLKLAVAMRPRDEYRRALALAGDPVG
jgi:Flp pilus assembly protein TadD